MSDPLAMPWTPDFSVSHYLPEFAQVHVHCIGNAIQPFHPLAPTSPSAFNLSQKQGLFQWVGCLHQMTKVLELQLQHQSFQWVFSVHFPKDRRIWSPCSSRDFQVSSLAPPYKGIYSLVLCLLCYPYLTAVHDHWENKALMIQIFVVRERSLLFNTLTKFVIAFLLINNCLLISWVQSPSTVILEPKKRKSVTLSPLPLPFSMM